MTFMDKILAMFQSRRFYMLLLGIVTLVLQDVIGLSEEDARTFVQIIGAWILGDSLTKTASNRKAPLSKNPLS